MRSKALRVAVALVPLVLTACVVFDIILFPLKLLFNVLSGIGETIGNAVSMNVEPIDGPAPHVVPMQDGRWMVEAPSEDARFRVTVSAPGHEPRTYTWPDDFRGVAAGRDGVARVDCVLASSR